LLSAILLLAISFPPVHRKNQNAQGNAECRRGAVW